MGINSSFLNLNFQKCDESFAVPVLDGGHLFFYAIEAIFKKPLPQKVQKVGFQVGLSLVLTLMIFTTFNDIWCLFK